jgi:hypothetical protein
MKDDGGPGSGAPDELERHVFRRAALEQFRGAVLDSPRVRFDARRDVLVIGAGPAQEAVSFDLPYGTVVRANRDGQIVAFEIYGFERLFLEEFPPLRQLWVAYKRSQSGLWRRLGFLGNTKLFISTLVERLSEIFTEPRQHMLLPI